jgi:hypothetical protein
VRDEILDLGCRVNWLYGAGFPKSLDVSKAIDKMGRRDYVEAAVRLGLEIPGNSHHDWTKAEHSPSDAWWEKFKAVLSPEHWQAVEREVLAGRRGTTKTYNVGATEALKPRDPITAPATEAARQWNGWGTALKPAHEPILVARKPLAEANIAANVLAHGTGGLNIDGCRIAGVVPATTQGQSSRQGEVYGADQHDQRQFVGDPAGRWPANLVLSHGEGCRPVGTRQVRGAWGQSTKGRDDTGSVYGSGTGLARSEIGQVVGHADPDGRETVEAWECEPGCPVAELDRQSGTLTSGGRSWRDGEIEHPRWREMEGRADGKIRHPYDRPSDSGGASRFFYVAKASTAERNIGLPPGQRNKHPTVKSVELMRWLCRLVTPAGGLVLDPFCGSGSTLVAARLEGFRAIGIDQDPESVETTGRRVAWANHQPTLLELDPPEPPAANDPASDAPVCTSCGRPEDESPGQVRYGTGPWCLACRTAVVTVSAEEEGG